MSKKPEQELSELQRIVFGDYEEVVTLGEKPLNDKQINKLSIIKPDIDVIRRILKIYPEGSDKRQILKLFLFELTLEKLLEARNRIFGGKTNLRISFGDEACIFIRKFPEYKINLTTFDNFVRDQLGIDLIELSKKR